jgi:hypothetical protein
VTPTLLDIRNRARVTTESKELRVVPRRLLPELAFFAGPLLRPPLLQSFSGNAHWPGRRCIMSHPIDSDRRLSRPGHDDEAEESICVFRRYYLQGLDATKRGDYDIAILSFRGAFLRSLKIKDSPFRFPLQWSAFANYTDLLQDPYARHAYQPTKIDWKIIRKVAKRKREMKELKLCFAAAASMDFGLLIASYDFNLERSAKYLRDALDLIDVATLHVKQFESEHDEVRSLLEKEGEEYKNPYDVLGFWREDATDFLKKFEDPSSQPTKIFFFHGVECMIASDNCVVRVDMVADLKPRLGAGGSSCDSCGKDRREMPDKNLCLCERCQMAYYCCRTCQCSAWIAGHNSACRKPGQIEPQDIMRLVHTESDDGHLVTVLENDGTNDQQWMVRYLALESTAESFSVSASNLMRIRPAK